MYIGHVAVALAAVRVRRDAPIWALLLASHWPDWVQLFFEVLGAYNAQLYSHSIPAILAGAALFTLVYVQLTGDNRSGPLIALVYLTHPLLDLVTGEKPLWPGGPDLGANWYDHPAKDFLLEAAFVCVAWHVYRNTFLARRNDRIMWGMLAALIGCQALLDLGQELRLRRRERDEETSLLRFDAMQCAPSLQDGTRGCHRGRASSS